MAELPEVLPPESNEIARKHSVPKRIVLGISATFLFGIVLWGVNQFLSLRGVVNVVASRIVLAVTVIAAILMWLSLTRFLGKRRNVSFWIGTVIVIVSAGFLDMWAPKPEHRKSVLVMSAYMIGVYGPSVESSQFRLVILNQPEEAVQNLDLTISRASNLWITGVSSPPFVQQDCKSDPINLFADSRMIFKGAKGERLSIDSREHTEEYVRAHGTPQWKLVCPRLSGHSSVVFVVTVAGNVEKDPIHVSGTYECIPSKGSTVVKVDSLVPVTK